MRGLAIIALVVGIASSARSQAPTLVDLQRWHLPLGSAAVIGLPGELDFLYQHVGEMPLERVDAPDAILPENDAAFVRLRLSPTVTLLDPGKAMLFNVYRLAVEADLLRDWWAVGDERAVLDADPRARTDTGLVGQRLSQLYAAASGEHLAVQLGLVRSRWGLGLLANGGDDPVPHTAESPFGYALQGDHVVRLGVSVFPLGKGLQRPALTAALAFDAVIDDDTARWSAGDRAYQFIAALRGDTDGFSAGLYAAHRTQTHGRAAGESGPAATTEVTAIDVTAKAKLADEAALRVYLEGELATVRGRTSLPTSVMHEGAFNVDQLGGLLRLAIESGVFVGVLEVGASSGDTNAFDDNQRAFSMDRDHRVGLLLFREVLMAQAALTVDNVADTDYRGEPPRGSDRLATQGAVRGSLYANPRISFRVADGLHLYGGFLYASTAGEYVDAFWSGLAGGVPRGPRNGARASELGWEVDLGVSWRIRSEPLSWRLRLEGAWCSPGAVFADADGKAAPDVAGVWAQAGLLW